MSPTDDANCHKDCIYNVHSKTYFVNHWGFIGCIIAVTVLAAVFFISYTQTYKNSQEQLLQLHEKYCNQLTYISKDDSVVVLYHDFHPIMDSHMKSISDSLNLQYDKLQNDYTILAIWASVLMIIFLIFSIYSMFKIDEIQKQGRESLRVIDETYSEVRKKSDNVDETVATAVGRIEKAIQDKIKDFTSSIEKKSSEVEAKVESYQKTVADAADKNNQLLELFVNSIIQAKAETPKSKSPKSPKQKK